MGILKSKAENLAERSEDAIQKIYDNKDKLIDKHDELSELRNKLQNDTEKYILESIIYQLSGIFMVSGYDAEMISIIPIIKNKHQLKCWVIGGMYRANSLKMMKASLAYVAMKQALINDKEIRELILESCDVIKNIINAYTELEEISK